MRWNAKSRRSEAAKQAAQAAEEDDTPEVEVDHHDDHMVKAAELYQDQGSALAATAPPNAHDTNTVLSPQAPSPNVYVKAFLTNGACKADFYSSIWRDQPNFAVTNSDNATCKKEKRVFWNYIQLRTWLIILMIHFEKKILSEMEVALPH